MISLVLVIENERERQILHLAFSQMGLRVLMSKPTYQNYVLIMQYIPDLILIELPHLCVEQLSFSKRIRSYKRTRFLPIIGYGNKTGEMEFRGILKSGISQYMERPLKIDRLLNQMQRLLKPLNKTIERKESLTKKDEDIALILQSDATVSQKTEAILRHVNKLAAFPFTIAKVLKITQDERSGAKELSQAIAADPLITTHLLKVANSVFFASSNRRINSIKDAIIRIGFTETKKIAMGMSVMNMFDKRNKSLGFDRVDFWYHSIATALITENIAKQIGLNTEEAFLAGLLHDLGMILLDDFFPSIFDKVLSENSKHAALFYNSEVEQLGVTHLDMIAELFPDWKLPQNITEAIVNQYKVVVCADKPDTPALKMAAAVAIGDACAKLLHIGRECDEYVSPITNDIMEAVKLSHGISSSFIDSIKQQVDTYSKFFGLENREHTCDCPEGINPADVHIGIFNPENMIFVPPVHFFQQRGVHCDTIAENNLNQDHNEKYHAIVCWSTEPVDPQKLQLLSNAKIAPFKSEKNRENSIVPVILFTSETDVDRKCGNALVINNSLDYRTLEEKMVELFTFDS